MTVPDSSKPLMKKSPSAVINKYYKNFGQIGSQSTLGKGVPQVKDIKKQRKDLTITFQKERSQEQDSN